MVVLIVLCLQVGVKNLFVLLALYACNHMSLCMTLVYCPGLKCIQEGWQYHSLVFSLVSSLILFRSQTFARNIIGTHRYGFPNVEILGAVFRKIGVIARLIFQLLRHGVVPVKVENTQNVATFVLKAQ